MPADSEERPRKNPFAPKKSTTVKRDKDEVYPHRKGLNRPEFLGDSPLDVVFHELEQKLAPSLDSATVELLAETLFPGQNLQISPFDLRYKVVHRLLQYLEQIQEYSMEAQAKVPQKNLVSISLHDLKTFGKLVNLIILLGIYPATSAFGIGVSIEKRRLNDFGKPLYKAMKVEPLEPAADAVLATDKYRPHWRLLKLIYDHLYSVFATDSDVRSLLLKGTGYADFLVVTITLITAPHFSGPEQQQIAGDFGVVTLFATTYELYQDYSLLVSTRSPGFFRGFVMEKLLLLPCHAQKGDGVLTLIEFVLGLRDNDDINVEKLDHVASVLLLKPAKISSVDYFTSIGNQCYELLVNINPPTIVTCVGHFLEQLWAKNHRIVRDFVLKRVWLGFSPCVDTKDAEKVVLVGERDLNNNVNVLLSLTNRGVPKDMLNALFTPILVPFWSYYCFLRKSDKPSEVAQNILVSYFTQISVDEDEATHELDQICRNLVADQEWKFRLGPNKLVEIVSADRSLVAPEEPEKRVLLFISLLDNNCESFLALVEQLDDALTKRLFASLLSNWVDGQKQSSLSLDENPFLKLVDLRLLESIGNKFKDRLALTPFDILQLVAKVLGGGASENPHNLSVLQAEDKDMDSDDEDDDDDVTDGSPVSQEVLTVVLELLSAIISEMQPDELDEKCRAVLAQIRTRLSEHHAQNKAGQSLCSRIGLILEEEPAPGSELEVEKRAFKRAISNLNDPLVPIRAHGLYLLRQLVEQRSAVISTGFVVGLHLVQLKDSDPFIYLNAIKGLESLLALDDTQVLPMLTSLYCGRDPGATTEKPEVGPADLDERLRIGEVLLRYVQAQDEAFSGQMARLVCESALSLIRRPANDAEQPDDRLRMSAMSILGTCCNTNILGIVNHVGDAIDCAMGVLELETAKEKAIMRRSAIVLLHDLIAGTSKSDKVPFPRQSMDKVVTVLRYVQSHDLDLLVREQAGSVFSYIDDLVEAAMAVDE